MKANTYAALLSLALIGAGSATAQTATTDPVGFSTLVVPVGTSLVVPTLNNSSVYTGMAAINAAGTTITPVNAPGWTASAYKATTFATPRPNYPKYYAEVVEVGHAHEGLVIDIDDNSSLALTVAASETAGATSIRGTTVKISIRKHVTIADVNASGLSPGEDSVSVYNNPTNNLPTVCYYDGGSSFLDSGFAYDVGHTPIYPGTGFAMSVTNNPVTLQFMGSVKMTKTQVNMFAASTNIVGPVNPASSTTFQSNTSLAAALTPGEDGINNFSTNGAMTILGTYYSTGTEMLDSGYSPVNSTDAIPLNRGVVVSVVANTVWKVPSPVPPNP
jgi:hypothetical protein